MREEHLRQQGDGNPYMCGYSWFQNFPVAPGNQHFDPFIPNALGWDNAVIMKFNAGNKQLEWATYYGGGEASPQGKTEARKLAVYSGLNTNLQYVFAVGTTNCSDFDSDARIGTAFEDAVAEDYLGGQQRMWVGAFRKSDGRRDWATTHGESSTYTWREQGLSIALDPNGVLAVGGRIYGYNAVTPTFPLVTPTGAFQQSLGGGFLMLFNSDYTIHWSTTFAGYFSEFPYSQVTDLRFTRTSADSHMKLWLTGATAGSPFNNVTAPSGAYSGSGAAFLASFDVPSLQPDYCTGWCSDGTGIGYGLDIAGKNIWVVGGTLAQSLTDTECPNPGGTGVYHTHVNGGSLPGRQCDGFILAFDVIDHTLKYGTLIGGSYYDMLLDVNHDPLQLREYITGETRSPSGFATDLDPDRYFQAQNANVYSRDAVVLSILNDDTSPTMLWRTPYGGSLTDRGWGIAASPTEVYLTGATASLDDFPLKEFDPESPLDFYQDYNFGGEGYGFLDWYDFQLGLDFENDGFGEAPPEPINQPHDGFIASFSSLYHVGIEEHEAHAPALTVVPLPAPGQWIVHLPGMDDWRVSAVDPAGRIVGNWRTFGPSLVVDLSAQPAGMYLLRAVASGKPYHAKVVRP